jgi:ankyrin repeat protein
MTRADMNLMRAIGDDNVAAAREAIDAGAIVEGLPGGATALMVAARRGATKCCRALADLCDPLASDGQGRTALHHAASSPSSNTETMEALAERCDAKALDNNGESALAIAFGRSGGAGMAKALLPRSDLDLASLNGQTPLMAAIGWGVLDMVKFVAPRCDLMTRGPEGQTALMAAASRGWLAGAKVIAEQMDGAGIEAADNHGKNAVQHALACGARDARDVAEALSSILAKRQREELALAAESVSRKSGGAEQQERLPARRV